MIPEPSASVRIASADVTTPELRDGIIKRIFNFHRSRKDARFTALAMQELPVTVNFDDATRSSAFVKCISCPSNIRSLELNRKTGTFRTTSNVLIYMMDERGEDNVELVGDYRSSHVNHVDVHDPSIR